MGVHTHHPVTLKVRLSLSSDHVKLKTVNLDFFFFFISRVFSTEERFSL